jgi:hypothetical protein
MCHAGANEVFSGEGEVALADSMLQILGATPQHSLHYCNQRVLTGGVVPHAVLSVMPELIVAQAVSAAVR